MAERRQVRQRLPARDPPRPLPADRRGETQLQQLVEGRVGGRDHRAEELVHRLGGDQAQRQPADQVDVAQPVEGERQRAAAGCCAPAASGRRPRGSRRDGAPTKALSDSVWSPTTSEHVVHSLCSPGSRTTNVPSSGRSYSTLGVVHRGQHRGASRGLEALSITTHGTDPIAAPRSGATGPRTTRGSGPPAGPRSTGCRRRRSRPRWPTSRSARRAPPRARRSRPAGAARRAAGRPRRRSRRGSWPATSTPGAAVGDRGGQPADRGGDHRSAAGLRLYGDQPERLAVGRHDGDVGGAVPVGQPGLVAPASRTAPRPRSPAAAPAGAGASGSASPDPLGRRPRRRPACRAGPASRAHQLGGRPQQHVRAPSAAGSARRTAAPPRPAAARAAPGPRACPPGGRGPGPRRGSRSTTRSGSAP